MRASLRILCALVLLAGVLGAATNRATAADGAAIFIYHRFGQDQYPTTNVTLAQFDAQIAAIQASDAVVLPLPEIVAAWRNGTPLPDNAVAITIDDGYRSVYAQAWPRLRAAGLPFTVFISTDGIDQGIPDLMTWDQIREMRDAGVTIGHHGAAHAHMADLGIDAAAADMSRASQRFQQELGGVPPLFAYPYGEYGLALRQSIEGLGFAAAFGQHSGVAHRGDDLFQLPRYPVNASTDLTEFRVRLRSLPLPLADVQPADRVIGANNPPSISFRMVPPNDGHSYDIGAMTCFLQGSVVSLSIDGDVVVPAIASAFPPGRTRLNCTMPTSSGRYRWAGLQFYRP